MDFIALMKEHSRMCSMYSPNDCNGCPHNEILCDGICTDLPFEKPEEFQKLILDWSALNPPPRLPTFKEWQRETFPHAMFSIAPCLFEDCPLGRSPHGCDYADEASDCAERLIPKELAEKLGIKPKPYHPSGSALSVYLHKE